MWIFRTYAFVHQLKKAQPNVPIIISEGHPGDHEMANLEE
jgi:hypothetical protein